ncbi:MAG TPA: hypothetical protein PLC12_06335, partial [Candidatus Methanofastidiosa archaeon]|nr:hypothetical protein [Candidatus Methanofastidiosa archaeon]
MGTNITEICGERTAAELDGIYGEHAKDIVEGLDILRLMQVPGLGKKKALSIIRKAYSEKYGDGFESILGGNSEKIYDKIVDILRSYIMTDEAKDIVLTYFPVREMDVIEERMSFFEDALGRYSGLEGSYDELSKQFKRIGKLKDAPKKKYYDYVIITDSSEAEPIIKNPLCDALYISTPADAEYAHNSYSFMI